MRKKALRAHHLYDVKREGSTKNRVVANGSRQHPDTYTDTTSPVSSQLILRLLLVFIAYRHYNTVQMDLTNAYLHAEIKDVVLIIIPDGFPGAGEVALLEKGLYVQNREAVGFRTTQTKFSKLLASNPALMNHASTDTWITMVPASSSSM
jgi:hypothetical protein